MIFLTLKTLYQKYRLHFIIWSIYILYEVFILGYAAKRFKPALEYVLLYLINISTFYIHAFLVKKVLDSKNGSFKSMKILLLILFMLLAYICTTYILIILCGKIGIMEFENWNFINGPFILSCIYRSLLYIGFATGYVYILKSIEERKKVEALERQTLVNQIEKQELENDLVQSQNNYLRSQINPHFLFNTLNFIYNDARKKAPMAADAIMNLAEMMRYALKRPESSEVVPLSEEIEQIEHLINLHKLRTANTINLELKVKGDLFGLKFPPLILLTLVENIFKHGNVSHSTQAAQIKIVYKLNRLNITTINMINDNKGKQTESHHVGIDNISKRLSNFYGNEFKFHYYKDQQNRYLTEIDVEIINPMARLNV